MGEQITIQVRMDNALRDQAKEIFDEIGIDMSTAVRMLFKATVRKKGLPFSTTLEEKKEDVPSISEQKDYIMNMFMYEPPIADEEGTVTVMPLQFGEVPLSMFIQLITKIPAGKISRQEDIFEFISNIYGKKVYELPKRALPALDVNGNDIPYWRIVSNSGGILGTARMVSREYQKELLEKEGIPVIQRGNMEGSYRVDNYKDHLFDFRTLKIIKPE